MVRQRQFQIYSAWDTMTTPTEHARSPPSEKIVREAIAISSLIIVRSPPLTAPFCFCLVEK